MPCDPNFLGKAKSHVLADVGLALLQIKNARGLTAEDMRIVFGLKVDDQVARYIAGEAEMGFVAWVRANEAWPELADRLEETATERALRARQRDLDLNTPRQSPSDAARELGKLGGKARAEQQRRRIRHLIPQGYGGEVAPTLNAAFGSKLGLDNQHIDSGAGLFVAHSLRGEGFDASEDRTGRGTPLVPVSFNLRGREDCAQPEADPDNLAAMRAASGGSSRSYLAFGWQNSAHQGDSVSDAHTPALDKSKVPAVLFNITPSNSNKDYNAREASYAQAITGSSGGTPSARGGDLIIQSAVRRLTPRECERLQGFPDDYTAVPYRGKPAADGPRYKALGNSMAVPVMRWIGERIAKVEAIAAESLAA